jgi:hypothetical protein
MAALLVANLITLPGCSSKSDATATDTQFYWDRLFQIAIDHRGAKTEAAAIRQLQTTHVDDDLIAYAKDFAAYLDEDAQLTDLQDSERETGVVAKSADAKFSQYLDQFAKIQRRGHDLRNSLADRYKVEFTEAW